MEKIQSFNEWFTGLEEGRQKVLREDKWMLAENAYNALKEELEAKETLIHEQHKQVMKKVEPRPYDQHDKKDGNWNYIHQEDVASAFVNCKAK